MNLASPSMIRSLCESLGCVPNKALGQNFLIDRNILNIILETAAVGREDRVLEIGPGLGILTRELATRCRGLWAVEKDRRLAQYLQKSFAGQAGVTIVHSDFLDLAPAAYGGAELTKMVSNLPFCAGSRILMEIFCMETIIPALTVTVQSEVAQRLAAKAGDPARGLLGIMAQAAFDVQIVRKIGPNCFYPRPAVDSAIVRMAVKPGNVPSHASRRRLLATAKHAFGFRRKQMCSVLERHPGMRAGMDLDAFLEDLGVDPRSRPENLAGDQWLALAEAVPFPAGKCGGRGV